MLITINSKTTYMAAGEDDGDQDPDGIAILDADFELNAARTLSVTFPSAIGTFAKVAPASTTFNLFGDQDVRTEYEVVLCDGNVLVYTCASAGIDAQSIAEMGQDCDLSFTVTSTEAQYTGTFNGTLVAIQDPDGDAPPTIHVTGGFNVPRVATTTKR